MFANKPVIGIAGGIGSGKSLIARLFAEEGCLVLSADDHVRDLYADTAVRQTLRAWWGDAVFNSQGEVDRKAVARLIFNDPGEKRRLESLLHPLVGARRDQLMAAAANDTQVLAFVWDIPLLFETGLDARCDAIVFVDTPVEQRLLRVSQTRGWDEKELALREKLQLPLDNKRRMSNYIIQNTADVGFVRSQVPQVLSAILVNSAMSARPDADSSG